MPGPLVLGTGCGIGLDEPAQPIGDGVDAALERRSIGRIDGPE